MRKRTAFVCSDCGASQPKWVGRCPECRTWNSMAKVTVDSPRSTRETLGGPVGGSPQPMRLTDVPTDPVLRRSVGIHELDSVLGGGLVPGALVLVAGEPGIGKSTLALQAADGLSRDGGIVLYVSGEESAAQLKMRAERAGIVGSDLFLLAETRLDPILRQIDAIAPSAVIVDSIQTMHLDEVDSAPGSVSQVRECTTALTRLAKVRHLPVIIVGHVTKAGEIAGPRVMEHIVDVVLQLEGERYQSYRLLRSVKNRFGSTNEVGVFEMRSQGLVEVPNPSAVFLSERLTGVPGSAVTVTMEGTRPMLVEVQALVSQSSSEVPRRTANGIDFNRLLLLIAVLTKRVGTRMGDQDVFVNVVGGLRVAEPAIDLAIALALASSADGVPLPPDLIILGEIGLSGELRSVSHIGRRLGEAAKLGFGRALVPSAVLEREDTLLGVGLEPLGARTLSGALERCRA